ncbi:HNH endonuclease [Massilia sp. CF038]|nr:HNH endonuclease [Massilia sp. CF038]
MDFEEWLYADGMSASTVKKYAGALRGPLTTWANTYRLTESALDEIFDLNEFAEIADRVADTPEFASRNKTGHQMYSAALQKYAAFLETIFEPAHAPRGPWSNELAEILVENRTYPAFDPTDQIDARAKVLRQVVQRQGQSKFRARLITAYAAKCAFSGCAVLPTLEAAHITPYLGAATNLTSNGLLLRADIHTLWDLGLLAIDPERMQVTVAQSIVDDAYRAMHGTVPFQPVEQICRPALAALNQQWRIFQGI